jgi:hypothetical protein
VGTYILSIFASVKCNYRAGLLLTAEDAELQRLLAQEEARQAAERVRAREAQARIAELQALAKYRHTQ